MQVLLTLVQRKRHGVKGLCSIRRISPNSAKPRRTLFLGGNEGSNPSGDANSFNFSWFRVECGDLTVPNTRPCRSAIAAIRAPGFPGTDKACGVGPARR